MGSPVPGADEFIIISGWLGVPQMEKALNISGGIKLVALYGMSASSGVHGYTHKSLTVLETNNQNLKIYYSLPGNDIHTKCYIWKRNGKIIKALIGSANFTNPGLNTPYKESLITVDTADFQLLEKYLTYIFDHSRVERCTSTNLQTRISTISRTVVLNPRQIIINTTNNQATTIRLTLLDRRGRMPTTSGLNWGQGSVAHTRPNDAYIKISKAAIRTGFFDPKTTQQVPIDVVWDDGTAMECQEEGNQLNNGILFPKQIASADRKEILGIYLRGRLGIPPGQRVTIQDLQVYGKTFIDVTKTGPNSYYMDFSRPRNASSRSQSSTI